jgi:hypothetical protein
MPFFVAGSDSTRLSSILPQAQLLSADRPTFSLTPLDDQEFTRKLFTPIPLEGIIYLSKTTWPISTVFRLYLEKLNGVSNAENASGPTPVNAPIFKNFLSGMRELQKLQDRGDIVFSLEGKEEKVGIGLPLKQMKATDMLEAAKNGYEYRLDDTGKTWTLLKKSTHPVLLVDPKAMESAEMLEVVKLFHLKSGLTKYDITEETISPFASSYPMAGLSNIDFETRSLLQALYFVSLGVDIPDDHEARGLVTVTHDVSGTKFDWHRVTDGLFHLKSSAEIERPKNAHVAIQYKGYWFYIEDTDQITKSTFSLLMELARMELAGKTDSAPMLTLPVGSR